MKSHLKSPLVPVIFCTLLSAAIFWLDVSTDDVLACSGCLVRKLKPSPQPDGSPSPLSLKRDVAFRDGDGTWEVAKRARLTPSSYLYMMSTYSSYIQFVHAYTYTYIYLRLEPGIRCNFILLIITETTIPHTPYHIPMELYGTR